MIDIKSILADAVIKSIESNIGFVVAFFVISSLLFFFRYEIGFDFDLTRREKNRLSEKSLLGIIFLGGAIIVYLFVKEYFFLLSCTLSVILTYFLYLFGFLDRIIEKLERRY
jgi:uncharacterized membrane protein YsdA (DUF1294 family)